MRIPKSWIKPLARRIITNLISRDLIEPLAPEENLLETTEQIILDELMVEDRLNEEVREILKKFEPEIEKGRLDYRKLFELTKQKLVKERNIIL
jgi:hypothetical protein